MGPDPRTEQRRQALLLDRLERKFRPALSREIARAMRDMANGFEITGEVMQPRDHYDALYREFERMAVASVATFGGRILDQGKSSGAILERKEDFAATMLRLALQYVAGEYIRRKITSIADTTRAQIVSLVSRGYSDGLGQREIAKAINTAIPSISRTRGAVIARTETHGAANYGAMVGAKETGLTLRKEWISAEDERTRLDHADMNGEIVGMDDTFDFPDYSLQFPGDPSGPPEGVINCRCAIGYVTVD